MKLVSFCTTCRGRLTYLQQTLLNNMDANYEPWVEFVLLDYGSDASLSDWVRQACFKHIEEGRLNFYRIEGPDHFFHSHAKNMAHLLAQGEYLCNLDCDNIAGAGLGKFLLDRYREDPNVVCRPASGGGRIALSRGNFLKFGGYDEEMIHGWGQEDNDFHDRLMHSRKVGYHAVPEELNKRLEHSNEERGVNCLCQNINASEQLHMDILVRHVREKQHVVNVGKRWGYWPVIEKNLSLVFPGEAVAATGPDKPSLW